MAAAASCTTRPSAWQIKQTAAAVTKSGSIRILSLVITTNFSESLSNPKGNKLPRTFTVRSTAREEEPFGRKLWENELKGSTLEGIDGLDADAIQEDIERLARKQKLDKLQSASYRKLMGEGNSVSENPSLLSELVEGFLVFDFFFILLVLAWFLAGIAQKAVSGDDGLLQLWLPLWDSVFQPAIGIFMAAAIFSAVSNYLKKKD
eukprot:TRINITY_DN1205_c0_g1_i2.p1 TRINITY_DN1205_c0_g1~~TRINITY_DN1205_c0_g1_i2.p1  ORF type:complete len:205 (-),score=38.10 TRINITY_DN1205_c0_g1_i2:256-870(-)